MHSSNNRQFHASMLNRPRNLLRNHPDPNANPRNPPATKSIPPSSTPHNKPSTPPSIPPLPPWHLGHNRKETLLPQLNHPCHRPPSQPVSPESQPALRRHSIPWPQGSTTSNYTALQQTPSLRGYCASAPNALKSAMLGTHSKGSLLKGTTASSGHRVYHALDRARIWALYLGHSVASRGGSRQPNKLNVSGFKYPGNSQSFQRAPFSSVLVARCFLLSFPVRKAGLDFSTMI